MVVSEPSAWGKGTRGGEERRGEVKAGEGREGRGAGQ
jgi:hypothetical protein